MAVNITINVQNAALPVTIGLPFRQSDNVLSTTALRVKTPGGTTIASSGAFEVLSRFGGLKTDNTKPIMIALVSFQPAAGVTGNYTVDDSAASFTPAPLTVTNGASTVRVQSSALDVTLNKTAADLIQSFVIGSEQLAAGSKPRLNAVGDASSITTVGLAAAGQNQITVASVLGLSIGATVKLKYEGTHAFTQGGAVVLNENLPYWNGTGLNRQFRMEPGGANQEDFTAWYIDPANGRAQIFYNAGQGPALSHAAGVVVRDQTLEADFVANGAYTINGISGTTVTLSRNLPVAIYEGTQVAVQGGGGGPVTGAFTPSATIVERQTDNLVTVRQRGNFASSVYPTIEVTIRWHFYAGMPWVRAQLHLNNYSKDTGAPVADVPISSLTFECPTATAASGSDSVTTDAAAIARVQAGTSAVTLSAGTFQFGIPEFAEKWPKGITGAAGGFHFQVFPSVVTLGAARATELEFFIGQSLTAPLTLTKRPTNATLDPAYVVSTAAHRGVTTVAQTWTASQLNNDTEMAEAANRTEQALAVMYDVTKSETYGAVPQLSAIEWRNRAEYGRQYGWDMFGTFNWQDDPRCYNHYDTQYHTLVQFMRTADMRALAVGSECARFMATYGTYQSRVFDGGNIYNQLQGVARFEDEDRRGPAFLSHSWFEGLWAYWSLTGDQQVYEAVLKSIEGTDQAGATQAGALMAWRWKPTGTNPYPGGFAGDGASWDIFTLQDGERYLGWSVMGLMAAYRYTGRADVLAMAAQYVSCFTAGEIAQGNHGYYIPVGFEDDNDPPADQAARRKVAFVNFGYPLNGVIEYWKQTGDTTVRDYISRVGKCVVYGDAQASSVRKDAIVQGGFAANGKWFSTDGMYFWWPGAQTTLAAGIASNATSLTLTDGSKFYADGGNIAISEGATTEYVQYASRTGNTLNGLTRARYGGTAAAFTTAAAVAPVPYQNDGVPCSGVAIDYLPVISTAAKISGDATISNVAKRVFKDVSLYFGILAQPLQTDRFFINLRTYGYPASSIKNWGQRAFGLEQYLADALANPVPVVSSISPTTKTAGDAQFTLTVNGTGFVSGAIVRVGGSDRVTTFISDTQLTATIPASDIATAGTLSITVFNPTPGGGTSNSVSLTVNAAGAPAPVISSLAPSSATAGGAAFTLTVNGSNFVSGATVRWNGSNRTTTFVSPAQLTAQITLADIATAGSVTVTVQNPDAQVSGGSAFTINNPAPTLSNISPTTKTAGDAQFTLTCTGSNFVNGAIVRVGGSDRVTTFISDTQLTATIPASDIATAGTLSITVFNPTPGGGTSNSVSLTVNAAGAPAPTISSISPSSGTAGGAAFTLTVNGSNFVSGATVRWNGSNRTTTFVSAAQLTAQITLADIASAGSATVTVQNPDTQVSGGSAFTINNPVPAMASISPTSKNAGDPQFTLTANGSNFVSGSVVRVGGADRATTFVSATQLTATIPASDLVSAGTLSITVFSPTPGGGTSAAQALTVNAAQQPPPPGITGLSPASAYAGSAAFTLTVNGADFQSGAVVKFNNQSRTTTFISATQLTAQIPASDLLTAGTAQVVVTNPDAQSSTPANFAINAQPAPTLSAISPTSKTIADPQFTLTLTGTNFTAQSVARVGGQDRATTYVSATQLTAVIPASDLLVAGTLSVTVFNPTPGGGTSASQALTVNNPTPAITSLNPSAVPPGSAAFTLTVNGSGFVSGAVVQVSGQNRTTTFVSATQLTAQVLSADVQTAGTLNVTVSNPTPGGGSSASSPLAVANAGVGQPTLTPGMTPIRLTLRARQGNTFGQTLVFSAQGIAYNLTGVTGRLQVRQGVADENALVLLELTTANGGVAIDALNGRITLNIAAAQSALLKFSRAIYELTLTADTGTVVTVAEGDFRVRRRITV